MEYKRILYKELSNAIQARKRCAVLKNKEVPKPDIHGQATQFVPSNEMVNPEWFAKHSETIRQLVADFMPSGSGWDCGTKIDLDASHADKLVLYGSFHHMHSESGMYDGWTEHTVTVTPSLLHDFNIRISGRDRNDIKEYLHEMFDADLNQTIVWDAEKLKWVAERYAKTQAEEN